MAPHTSALLEEEFACATVMGVHDALCKTTNGIAEATTWELVDHRSRVRSLFSTSTATAEPTTSTTVQSANPTQD